MTPPELPLFGRTMSFINVCIMSLFTALTIFFILNIRRIFYRQKHNLKRKVNYYLAY